MINISTMKACGPGAYEEMGSNIKLPYSGHIPGGIGVGTDIVISGRPLPNCDRFSLNLCIGPTCQQDCALHFNPRFDAGTVVRNHMQGGSWGMEEVSGVGPFRKGQNFDMIINVNQRGYKITVNNNHFCDFQHRLPKESVQYLYINGSVVINFIQCRGGGKGHEKYPAAPPPQRFPHNKGGDHVAGRFGKGKKGAKWESQQAKGRCNPEAVAWKERSDAPPPYPGPALNYPGGASSGGPFYNPPVPFTSGIPGGMSPGRIIYISGVPHPKPSRFTVNLACGSHESVDFGLHFDVRFSYGSDRNQTIRTHKQGGVYGAEERHQNYFPCAPNSPFEMMILAEPNCFKIAFNNQHFCEFYHRIHPFQRNTHVMVTGDVRLTEVRFQ